jgi:hypothetical protein
MGMEMIDGLLPWYAATTAINGRNISLDDLKWFNLPAHPGIQGAVIQLEEERGEVRILRREKPPTQ